MCANRSFFSYGIAAVMLLFVKQVSFMVTSWFMVLVLWLLPGRLQVTGLIYQLRLSCLKKSVRAIFSNYVMLFKTIN